MVAILGRTDRIDVNAQDVNGSTPLLLAARKGCQPKIIIIVQNIRYFGFRTIDIRIVRHAVIGNPSSLSTDLALSMWSSTCWKMTLPT